tara:strand:- start:142 stop:348 length:207 start_codon:yes stop_codon:yes gene_type:complete
MKLTEIEHSFAEINKEYDEGNLEKEEYKDLLQGLEIEQTITENADELHRKQELQKNIEIAIKAVSAIF